LVPIAGCVPLKVIAHNSSPKLTHEHPCAFPQARRSKRRLRQSMVQLASHTTSKAQRAVVAATTTATAMIVPIVIVQTPVRASKGCLRSEVVVKRARMLIHLITVSIT
jgi:hypothetical protein